MRILKSRAHTRRALTHPPLQVACCKACERQAVALANFSLQLQSHAQCPKTVKTNCTARLLYVLNLLKQGCPSRQQCSTRPLSCRLRKSTGLQFRNKPRACLLSTRNLFAQQLQQWGAATFRVVIVSCSNNWRRAKSMPVQPHGTALRPKAREIAGKNIHKD